jgi:hypothetical protein
MIHIDIPGGEPFLSGVAEQKELLTYYIQSGQANQISLHYTTNATIFPDTEWWSLWQHFNEIDLQLSIDGIKHRYEYIRFPADWNVLTNNVIEYIEKEKQLANIRLSVSHTVSAYNIYYLDEFFSWCYNIGLPRPWLGRVHIPEYMRPEVWPTTAKQFIMQKLQHSTNSDVLNWSELLTTQDNSQYFVQFQRAVKQHDDYRGTNFNLTFPEMATFL